MKITVRGKNIVVTEAIKEYAETKLQKLDKYMKDNDVECRVLVRTYNVGTKVEATILGTELTLRAEVKNDDLYAAIDLVVDKLQNSLVTIKQRKCYCKKCDRPTFDFDAVEAVEEATQEIRYKEVDISEPITVEEAILMLESSDHTFFMFRDKDYDGASAVVYKKDDGNYGVILEKK